MKLLILLVLFTAMSARAAQQSAVVDLLPNQAVVQVNGIVCSFCAYGAEKNLSKLDFLDQTQFGNDGVLIDIHAHRITLALQSGRQVDVARIYKAIKDGGYDPVKFYLNLDGQISKDGDRFLLTTNESQQAFELIDYKPGKIKPNAIGILDAARIPSIKPGQPIPVTIL